MLGTGLENSLKEIFGEDDVLYGTRALEVYSTDASPFFGRAIGVVRPENEREISKLLRLCGKHGIPVVPRGSGSGTAGGAVPENAIVVDMKKMSRIEVNEDDMIVYAEAGAIIGDIKDELAKHDLFIPTEPGSVRIATIGGFVANNGSGKRGLKYGTIRNYVVGMNVVLPDGKIVRMPGETHRVPGLSSQLFIGSEGTLGVITGVYLRALPAPESSVTYLIRFDSLNEMLDGLRKILRCLPDAVEYIDERCASLIGLQESHYLAVEVFGGSRSVENLISSLHAEVLEGEDERRFWTRRETLGAEIAKKGTRVYAGEDFAVPFSRLAEFITEIRRIERDGKAEVFIYGHMDTANIHPAIVSDDPAESLRMADELYSLARKLEATVGEHGVAKRWTFLRGREVYRRLKYCLDPLNIMNPGKFGI